MSARAISEEWAIVDANDRIIVRCGQGEVSSEKLAKAAEFYGPGLRVARIRTVEVVEDAYA